MLTESLRAVVNEALAPYGASLGDGDVICSIKKPTGVRVDAKAGRGKSATPLLVLSRQRQRYR